MEFDWDAENIVHVAQHNVGTAEVEQVLSGYTLEIDYQIVDFEERYVDVGVTLSDRFLEVVTTHRKLRVRPITAYDAARSSIDAYLRSKDL